MTTLKIARSDRNATPSSPWSDAACRRALHFALSQVNVSAPAGFFPWLEKFHPNFATDLLVGAVTKIDLAWGTPRFADVLDDFLFSISAAIAMHKLTRDRGGDEAGHR